jgi:VWFA-related protein
VGLLWLGLMAVFAQSQTPATIIRVPVRLVTAPTLVFSGQGRLVPGLEKTDFRILDNGRLQKFSLDTDPSPVSVVFVIQVSQEVREYVRFISKTGSTLEALLVGETGEAAVITYNSEVTVVAPFGSADVQTSLRKLAAGGKRARMIDAGLQGIALLKQRPSSRARVVVFIGQPVDRGSESALDSLREQAEKENVAIYALTLPEFGKAFVSDTFWLHGPASPADRGGFSTGVDVLRLGSFLSGSLAAGNGTDPFTVLTAATGGTQLHVRKQDEFEDAVAMIGVELRSGYVLSYSPSSTEPGYHAISVEVNRPGAITHTRPGYWLGAN